MRNLVVCCDGTTNTPDQRHDGVPVPTNVVRLYNSLQLTGENGTEPQRAYYHPGVGTAWTRREKLAAGGMGVTLGKNIMSAYKWLGVNCRRDDHIFLFGFSRGAYTVRSLAGMISNCGLLDLGDLTEPERWKRVETAYSRGYQLKQKPAAWAKKDWAFHGGGDPAAAVRIRFLGVWDTVGALGLPNDMALLNAIDDPAEYAFHDTQPSELVQHARHAVALDEMRASFAPTLWSDAAADPGSSSDPERSVKQMWFPGVHCDVGGGYPEKGLSDGALKWMMDEAAAVGLRLRPDMYAQVTPDARDVLHDSFIGLYRHLRTEPRTVPPLRFASPAAEVHRSAHERQASPPIAQAPYRPTAVLALGQQEGRAIYAVSPWNDTGIYLEAGATYEFTAAGQWIGRSIKCGPGGTRDGRLQSGEVAYLASSLWGQVGSIFRRLTGNEDADVRGTRRVENLPWFCLVGVIANGGSRAADGTPTPHQVIPIRERHVLDAARSGYLYCFANDAWRFYDNNRGSVRLTVRRTA